MNIRTKTAVVSVTILLASSVLVGNAFAQTGNTRPGWGYGDKKHVHTGPPGQSVRPDRDDDDNQGNIHEHNEQLRQEITQFIARLRLLLFQKYFHSS